MEREFIIGLDIGGTNMKCGIFTPEYSPKQLWEIQNYTSEDEGDPVSFLINDLEFELNKLKINRRSIKAIGIAIAANVSKNGDILGSTNLSEDYSGMFRSLHIHFGCPVKAANDSDMAALGESYKGAAKDAETSVTITIGTGVGSGIVIGRKVLAGAHAAGGEAGHIHTNDDETDACGCGNHGCIEQYASSRGLVNTARKLLEESDTPSTLRGRSRIDPIIIFSSADLGDEIALKAIDIFCGRIGWLCASISCIVDPDTIVLGGGVSLAGKFLLDNIHKYFEQYAYNLCRDTNMVLASLGPYSGAYGAAVLASKKDGSVFID